MDDNATHTEPTTRAATCACCGRRGVHQRLLVTGPGAPRVVTACPYCDLRPAELQGWLADFPRA
ncbi:hypothetical protein H7X46_20815 [Pseudonocardia sp. C8]|uniref:hypothetical protein n=1 Tax=Pseudonocardia sp. C8 TaxID=2762759 RepID=UPI001642CA68|nr:hypothetical protein [Pseudonocardia sp. C8]MBC3193507.1 hypothetical protein [Pseudonocardia sp. C8]